jgi:hypothetical protein
MIRLGLDYRYNLVDCLISVGHNGTIWCLFLLFNELMIRSDWMVGIPPAYQINTDELELA